jgi:hypothetical protein
MKNGIKNLLIKIHAVVCKESLITNKQVHRFKILLRFKNIFFVVVEKQCFDYLVNLIIVQCDPATTCNGHGECQEDGSCKCSDGFFGDSCSSISISFGLVLGQSGSLEFLNLMSF